MSMLQIAVAQVMTPSWWNEPGEERPRERKEKRELSRNRQQFNTERRMKTAMIRERVTEAQKAEYDQRGGKAWLVRELSRKPRK